MAIYGRKVKGMAHAGHNESIECAASKKLHEYSDKLASNILF
jgi:hypothetical protein